MLKKLFVFGLTVALIDSAPCTTIEIYPELLSDQLYSYYQAANTQQDYAGIQQNYASYNNLIPNQYYLDIAPQQLSGLEAKYVIEIMIIAAEGLGSRNNGPLQWHQVNSQNYQPNNIQSQPTFDDPMHAELNSIFSITDKPVNQVRPNNNNQQSNQPQVNPTVDRTTTEKESGPVWSSGDDAIMKRPVDTITSRPTGLVWFDGNENTNTNNKGNNGFTIIDEPTTKRPFANNPFINPTTRKPETTTTFTTTTTSSDEDGPIEIIMGK